MPNNRIFYATQKAGVAPAGSNSYTTIRGLQSIGMTTNFNLEQVFEIGKLAIYENIEGIPDVQVDLEKVLDGYAPIYTLATQLGTAATLVGRSNAQCSVAVSVYPETVSTAEGTPGAEVKLSGLYVSSVGYSVQVDGPATESVSLIGNNKVWKGLVAGTVFANYADGNVFTNSGSPKAVSGSGGVNFREDVLFSYDGTSLDANGATSGGGTVLPQDIPGVSSSGTNNKVGGQFQAHLQSFNTSVDLGREDLFELGRRGQYHKFVNFPIEVTTEIAVIASSGDLVSATEEGIIAAGAGGCSAGSNLLNRTIRLHMCEGLQVDLGKLNKLSTVGVTGGDAGGGNVEVTYSYTNFNDFSVFHPSDPSRAVSAFQPGF